MKGAAAATTYNQYGYGLTDIGQLYRNPVRVQRGRGIGSVFAGLWKQIAPLAMSGLRALGHQTMKTGVDVLGDLQGGKDWRTALRDRSNLAGQQLAEKTINKLKRIQQKQIGRGLLTHTTLGGIKAGNSRKNMLVGHLKRKRVRRPQQQEQKRRRRRTAVNGAPSRKKQTRRRRRGRQQGGGCSKQQQTGGGGAKRKYKRKRASGAVVKRRRKAARSIDIFDI